MGAKEVMAVGAAARRLGVPPWKVRRLFERKLLPEPARVGPYRVITEADLPAVRAALLAAGYMRGEPACHAS
jgi:hypothetical protein